MSESPEQIRANIERTRAELGGDVDALADKVNPSKIAHRQTDKVKNALGSVKDRVFGAADDVTSSLASSGESMSGAMSDAKDKVAAKAEGNPIAVGLIAFGVGMLVSSLVPAASKEKEVAATLKDQAQPLVDQVTDVAKEVGENLKQPAQEAVATVKDAATDAVDGVKSETTSAADEIKDRTQQSKDNLAGS